MARSDREDMLQDCLQVTVCGVCSSCCANAGVPIMLMCTSSSLTECDGIIMRVCEVHL